MHEIYGLARGEPKTCMAKLNKIQASRRQTQVPLSQMKIYHINQVTEDMVELCNVSDIAKTLEAEEVVTTDSTVGIKLNQFSSDVVRGMKEGRFSTIAKVGKMLLAFDNSARMRASLLKITGATGTLFYDRSILADIALARVVDCSKKTVIITYGMSEGIGIALWTATGFKEYEDMTTLEEWNNDSLKLGNWSVTEHEQMLEFDGDEVNGFVPVIRCVQSIVGNGNFQREYCIRERDAAISILLPVKTFDDVKIAATKQFERKPVLSTSFKKIVGQKRANYLGKLINEVFRDEGADAAMRMVLRIPEKIGPFTKISDLSEEIGRIYVSARQKTPTSIGGEMNVEKYGNSLK